MVDGIPHCPICGATARPNVSMFGDTNFTWVSRRSEVQKANLLEWLNRSLQHEKVAIIELGCGTSLHSLSIESEMLVASHPSMNEKSIHLR